MNKHQFIEQVVNQRMVKTTHLIVKKGNSYNINEDPFQAFKDGKNLTLSKSELSYCLALMAKHYKSIMDLVENYERYPGTLLGKEAVVDEKIGDLIAYLVNLEGMFYAAIRNIKNIKENYEEVRNVEELYKEMKFSESIPDYSKPPLTTEEESILEKIRDASKTTRIVSRGDEDYAIFGPSEGDYKVFSPPPSKGGLYESKEEIRPDKLNISEIS